MKNNILSHFIKDFICFTESIYEVLWNKCMNHSHFIITFSN